MKKRSNAGMLFRCVCLCLSLLTALAMPVGAVAQELQDPGTQRQMVAVHYAPSVRSMVIGYLENGTTLAVLEEIGDFYKIDCYDMTGFLAKELVVQKDNQYYVNYKTGERDVSVLYSRSLVETLSKQHRVYTLAMPLQGIRYVWGGSSPTTSFDCSGFVSYVINNCGNGWYVGRKTANGLLGCCTTVSAADAKPGDLVFFQGTYETTGASHVGIYVGDGMMLHCGNPIQYTSINTSYWQQHFYTFGRIND